MKSKSEEKWLGDILSDQGLEKSVEATINSRFGKIQTAIFELKVVLEDLRMQVIGGLKCGMDIWELALIPSLTNNSGTWTHMSTQSVEKLDKLQNLFLQTLFAVGQSCPRPTLCWDTATVTMQTRVEKSKLLLLHHIKNLDNSSLAKQVYKEQSEHGWTGLVAECEEILKQWNLNDIFENCTKSQWKSAVKKEAKLKNEDKLRTLIKKSSKLEVLKGESYGEKSYISDMKMQDARMNFSLRSRMYDCKMNFLNNPVFKAEMWRCDSCQSCVDSQSHILYCPAYHQLREGRSLSSDQDIVSYFKEVLAIRSKLDLNR